MQRWNVRVFRWETQFDTVVWTTVILCVTREVEQTMLGNWNGCRIKDLGIRQREAHVRAVRCMLTKKKSWNHSK